MRLIGLTGGIASGKTMVTDYLAELGAPIIDADVISRELTSVGSPVLDEIAAAFGTDCLDEKGALRRQVLGQIIFNDDEARRRLNQIMHPKIRSQVLDTVEQLRQDGVALAVYAAPLLLEAGQPDLVDEVWVVALDPQEQARRLVRRDGIDQEAADRRISAQSSLETKLALADKVIDNNGSREDSLKQVLLYWNQAKDTYQRQRRET